MVNGAKSDEAITVRPVSVAQRNNRMSILGGKKKPSDEPSSPQSRQSRDAARRASLFHLQSGHGRNRSADQLGLSEGHSVTIQGPSPDEFADGGGLVKKPSVRKRLSLLKLGVMKGKGTAMGSLDEE